MRGGTIVFWSLIALVFLLLMVNGMVNNKALTTTTTPDIIILENDFYRVELWKSKAYSAQSFIYKPTGNEWHTSGVLGSGTILDTSVQWLPGKRESGVPDPISQEFHTVEMDAIVTEINGTTTVAFRNSYLSTHNGCVFRYNKTLSFNESNVIVQTLSVYPDWNCIEHTSYVSGYINTNNHPWNFCHCGDAGYILPEPKCHSTSDVGRTFADGCPFGMYSDTESFAIVTLEIEEVAQAFIVDEVFGKTYLWQPDCADRFREDGMDTTTITSYVGLFGGKSNRTYIDEFYSTIFVPEVPFEIPLVGGWNLISLPKDGE